MVVVENNILRNACANEEDRLIIRDKTIIILELYKNKNFKGFHGFINDVKLLRFVAQSQ
jgi:hypothetical protein